MCKKLLFTYFNLLFLCMWLQVTHQGQIKVRVQLRSFLRRDTLTRVVYIWIKCVLVFSYFHFLPYIFQNHGTHLPPTIVLIVVVGTLVWGSFRCTGGAHLLIQLQNKYLGNLCSKCWKAFQIILLSTIHWINYLKLCDNWKFSLPRLW